MALSIIGVIGSGHAAWSIARAARLCAPVLLYDRDPSGLLDAQSAIMVRTRRKAVQPLRICTSLQDLAGADLIIDTVAEDLLAKQAVFRSLDRSCGPHTLLTTTTTAMSITALAAATRRAENVCGLQFAAPVATRRLVEVIRGFETGDETVRTLCEILIAMGKTPVVVNGERGSAGCDHQA